MTTIKKISLLVFVCLLLGGVPAKAQYGLLHSFGASSDGSYPLGSLTYKAGTLYGLASEEGLYGYGMIFSMDTNGTAYSDIYDFNTTNGETPTGSLLFSMSGDSLLGMTSLGGTHDSGVIFAYNIGSAVYSVIYNFNGVKGAQPYGSLTYSITKDTLFGMTSKGGVNHEGCIFALSHAGITDMLDFNGTNGANPQGSLILSASGDSLFGMTLYGGAKDSGVIFSVKTNGTAYTDLHDCTKRSGFFPAGSLTLSARGDSLFGMVPHGGAHITYGNIFSLTTTGALFTDLYDFNSSNGAGSFSSLLLFGGLLYGMTGHVHTTGNMFSLETNGGGYQNMLNFSGTAAYAPYYTALIVSNDVLYGMTQYGGQTKIGEIFRYRMKALYSCH